MTRQSGQLVFSRTSDAFKGFTGDGGRGGGTYGITVVIEDAKSRSVDVDMFVAGSAVPLTHGQRAVSQGHVVFEGEALA